MGTTGTPPQPDPGRAPDAGTPSAPSQPDLDHAPPTVFGPPGRPGLTGWRPDTVHGERERYPGAQVARIGTLFDVRRGGGARTVPRLNVALVGLAVTCAAALGCGASLAANPTALPNSASSAPSPITASPLSLRSPAAPVLLPRARPKALPVSLPGPVRCPDKPGTERCLVTATLVCTGPGTATAGSKLASVDATLKPGQQVAIRFVLTTGLALLYGPGARLTCHPPGCPPGKQCARCNGIERVVTGHTLLRSTFTADLLFQQTTASSGSSTLTTPLRPGASASRRHPGRTSYRLE